jgi:4-amino-4-deoxy-L-arabinose transferase-like glycosyltransferase
MLCLAGVPLLGWWLTGLFDLDEGFYAAVVGEMNRRGEWITPFYNGQPWFEKPILLYWLAKPMVALLGDAVGPRLPSVLSAIGCYFLVAWYARRRVSEEAATWTVIVLSTSLIFVALGRLMMTDVPLVLAFSAAMFTFWDSLVGNPRWRLATAALLGVAVLAKGPVALILFALIAGWTFYRQPELRPNFRGQWLLGTLILVAVIATWYLPAYLANGDLFVQKFLIEQNIGRFTGGDQAHTIRAAWAYVLYIPVIFVGLFPWSIWLWKTWRERIHIAPTDITSSKGNFTAFLWAWAIIIFVFFSVSSAKLPHYVLPVFVPLSMLLGSYFGKRRTGEGNQNRTLVLAWAMVSAVTIAVNFGFLWWYQASGQEEAHTFARYIRDNSLRDVPRTVSVFQLPRRDKSLGTGKPKLQETSLPSFLLYLDSTVDEAESVDEVIKAGSHWLFTRRGRITPRVVADFQSEGKALVPAGPAGENYELYELKPLARKM